MTILHKLGLSFIVSFVRKIDFLWNILKTLYK